jgi:hypothetical protein
VPPLRGGLPFVARYRAWRSWRSLACLWGERGWVGPSRHPLTRHILSRPPPPPPLKTLAAASFLSFVAGRWGGAQEAASRHPLSLRAGEVTKQPAVTRKRSKAADGSRSYRVWPPRLPRADGSVTQPAGTPSSIPLPSHISLSLSLSLSLSSQQQRGRGGACEEQQRHPGSPRGAYRVSVTSNSKGQDRPRRRSVHPTALVVHRYCCPSNALGI